MESSRNQLNCISYSRSIDQLTTNRSISNMNQLKLNHLRSSLPIKSSWFPLNKKIDDDTIGGCHLFVVNSILDGSLENCFVLFSIEYQSRSRSVLDWVLYRSSFEVNWLLKSIEAWGRSRHAIDQTFYQSLLVSFGFQSHFVFDRAVFSIEFFSNRILKSIIFLSQLWSSLKNRSKSQFSTHFCWMFVFPERFV